jgi:SAM-dependent methyltransferase
MSLRKRPRICRVTERAANRALRAVGSRPVREEPGEPLPPKMPAPELPSEHPPSSEAAPLAPENLAREIPPELPTDLGYLVSRRLFERLSDEEVMELDRRIREDAELGSTYSADHSDEGRRYLLLAFGTWLGSAQVIEKVGLGAAEPPEDVHAMARGPLAAAGGLYEADLVVEVLADAGIVPASLTAGLDFGCSSGRVVRVLAAAYPEIEWSACDPNTAAIAWAGENLPGINFFVNGDSPPLDITEASLDLVYAISIWSHFEPQLGLRWFEEMHRVIRPGGYLVCTTHGLTSIAFYATNDLRTPEQSRQIADSLYSRGWWYAPEFGDEGDWGVINPDWGTAFLSTEWLLSQLCPSWRVVKFARGRNQHNQDVYVLQRV